MSEVTPQASIQSALNTLLTRLPRAYLEFINKPHNQILQQHGSYVVGGMYFSNATERVTPLAKIRKDTVPMRTLPANLFPQHAAWYQTYREYEREWATVSQQFRSIGQRLQSWQELRDVLPEQVIRPALDLEGLQGLTRSQPDLYAGAPPTNPALMSNYRQERKDREAIWGERLVYIYDSVAPTVDLYVGFKVI